MEEPTTQDLPVPREQGLNARRERRWGVAGGLLGALFGVGSAAIAVFVEGAPWTESAPYPRFFTTPRLLTYDLYLAATLAVGFGFLVSALVYTRLGRHPRTDGFGAGLLGTILMSLSGLLIFLRLFAVVS